MTAEVAKDEPLEQSAGELRQSQPLSLLHNNTNFHTTSTAPTLIAIDRYTLLNTVTKQQQKQQQPIGICHAPTVTSHHTLAVS
jgi:hypothetical protein